MSHGSITGGNDACRIKTEVFYETKRVTKLGTICFHFKNNCPNNLSPNCKLKLSLVQESFVLTKEESVVIEVTLVMVYALIFDHGEKLYFVYKALKGASGSSAFFHIRQDDRFLSNTYSLISL